eukprot:TRINITY_DN1376_c0_g1_i1.p1 TRINITY_DN1376_c0_g1~~TRINITY_DN1376_c0_g1_i1.p1  ORF type:complete len:116 (-),score=42.04 TRINITY_DN1376_c0_g1_i1:110-457(-)
MADRLRSLAKTLLPLVQRASSNAGGCACRQESTKWAATKLECMPARLDAELAARDWDRLRKFENWTYGDLKNVAVISVELAAMFCLGEVVARGAVGGYPVDDILPPTLAPSNSHH